MTETDSDEVRSRRSHALLDAGEDVHERWASDYLNPYIEPLYEAACDRVVEALGAPPDAEVLDAGCGYALHAIRLARRGLRVTGVDFSASALAHARENVEAAGLGDRIALRQGNLLSLPFEDASFAFVHCWGVLMHVPELEKALAELARVLRPGGRMALCENDMRSLHVRFFEPALRGVKRALGRALPERSRTPRGIEEWRAEGLLVRKTDLRWLVAWQEARGLRLVERFPSQFTELYTHLPAMALKRAVYRWNQLHLAHARSARGAMGNVLVFEKAS